MIISVTRQPMALVVTGTLTSTPNAVFTIDLFASDSDHSGRIFLGFTKVRINKSKVATFTFTGPLSPQRALHHRNRTGPVNNTSEFSTTLV